LNDQRQVYQQVTLSSAACDEQPQKLSLKLQIDVAKHFYDGERVDKNVKEISHGCNDCEPRR
jgi:hypothetical protein